MRFLLQRLAFYLFTAWAAITLNFFIPRMVPGDPVQSLIARNQGRISADAIASLRVLFGLDSDRSLWEQYVAYWGQLLRGDLGLSFTFFPAPVSEVIGEQPAVDGRPGRRHHDRQLPARHRARRRRRLAARLLDRRAAAGHHVPLLDPVLLAGPGRDRAVRRAGQLLPVLRRLRAGPGAGVRRVLHRRARIQHSILPAATILVSSMSGWILSMRNMMVTVASEDYITVAHAKGLSERRVALSYAARNALLPNVSGFALSLGFIVGGTLLVEIVFSYPGLGFQLFQAVGAKDYPLMQGIFLIITISVLVANLLADVAYLLLDPRTRKEG